MAKLKELDGVVAYARANPGIEASVIARQFDVPARTLSGRLSGAMPKKGNKSTKTLLSEPEEKAICNYSLTWL